MFGNKDDDDPGKIEYNNKHDCNEQGTWFRDKSSTTSVSFQVEILILGLEDVSPTNMKF